jgi:hypothetical protein
MPPPQPKSKRGQIFQNGPGATRTRDLLLRRQALYPTELRTRSEGGNSLGEVLCATKRRWKVGVGSAPGARLKLSKQGLD